MLNFEVGYFEVGKLSADEFSGNRRKPAGERSRATGRGFHVHA